jgi:hypothetical protein
LTNSHVITRCNRNLVIELDHRPALEVLKEDIGEVLAKDKIERLLWRKPTLKSHFSAAEFD